MTCTDIRESLAAYLDGEIDGAPRRAMDAHFALCGPCAAERHAQAAAWVLLDRAPLPAAIARDDPATAAAFRGRLAARLRSGGGTPSGRILRLPAPVAAAAAAALLAAVAAGVVAHRRGTDAAPGTNPGGDTATTASVAAPPRELLAQLGLLESLDALEDEDLALLESLADVDPDDLAVLGG